MKNFLLAAFVLLVFSTGAQAQKVYFIFLQSENNQPFYVKMANKVYSSSSTGYLIIPDLKENSYNFNLGFANINKPEANFSVDITNTDRGLLIKNTDEGFSLFDLQSLAVYKPVVKDVGTVQTTTRKTDSFTQLLSKAADDESILTSTVTKKIEPPVVKEEVKKPSEVVAIAPPTVNTTDTTKTVAVLVEPEVKQPIVEEKKQEEIIVAPKPETTPVVTEIKEAPKSQIETAEVISKPVEPVTYNEPADSGMETFKRTLVTKRSESSTTEGFGLVFLDDNGIFVDTIRLLIPNPKIVFAEEVKPTSEEVKPIAEINTENLVQPNQTNNEETVAEPVKTEKKGILARRSKSENTPTSINDNSDDVSLKKEEPANKIEAEPATKPEGKGLLERIKKSDSKESAHTTVNGKTMCAAFASDNDFMKLRRNMAAKNTDDAMVDEAKKIFKSKCFTTEQIKNLSYLFLSPAGKYQLFDVAYNYVVDQWQYNSLENEIKDDYYQKRFKALIGD
jgi:hypothetical protein